MICESNDKIEKRTTESDKIVNAQKKVMQNMLIVAHRAGAAVHVHKRHSRGC
jgi:hypothetical protein